MAERLRLAEILPLLQPLHRNTIKQDKNYRKHSSSKVIQDKIRDHFILNTVVNVSAGYYEKFMSDREVSSPN